MPERKNIARIVNACIKRDEGAWAEFIRHFSGLVSWAIRDRLGRRGVQFNKQDVEDISQFVFSEIWKKNRLAGIQNKKSTGYWLVLVASNLAFNYIRDKNRANRPLEESVFLYGGDMPGLSDSQDGYSALENNEVKGLVHDFIKSYPPEQKTVLALNYLYGKKHREIAEIVKMPIGSISSIIKRARAAISKELRRKGYENF